MSRKRKGTEKMSKYRRFYVIGGCKCFKRLKDKEFFSLSLTQPYMCNNYKTFGKSVDTSHWIEARQLYDCVLADIRKHAAEALADNDELCRKLAGQIGTDKAKQAKTLEKELRAKNARLSEVDNLFQSLYEDKLNGKISERNYQMMSRRYEEEQGVDIFCQ